MIPIVYGKAEKKVVVLVSGWEPLLPLHYAFIQDANRYSMDNDMELLLVMFDPHPSELVSKTFGPKFHSAEARIALLHKRFTGAVCKLIMKDSDLESGAAEFLSVIEQYFNIAELWLRNGQSLGSGAKGSLNTISQICDNKGIRLNNFNIEGDLSNLTSRVRQYLSEGDIRAATEIVGHAPIWTKQSDIFIPIGWKPGTYRYYPLLLIADKFTLNGRYKEVEIFMETGGYSAFKWPDEALNLIAITN